MALPRGGVVAGAVCCAEEDACGDCCREGGEEGIVAVSDSRVRNVSVSRW